MNAAAPLRERPSWPLLAREHARLAGIHLRELFAADPDRGVRMTADAAGLHLDYSKNRVGEATIGLLARLAEESGLPEHREAMFRGEPVNPTEDRPALHVALRMPRDRSLLLDGVDVVREVHDVLDRMSALSERVRDGSWRGHTGRRIRTVVNIGIGGSDLGPAMACEALAQHAHPELGFRFIANVDGAAFASATAGLDPAETLFVVCSKSFTTLETMANAQTAREWVLGALGDPAATASHFVAVSTNSSAVAEFGVAPANMLGFWDWVGGRYSLCSAIGLSLMIAVGPERFREMLAGFHAIDEHFREAPAGRNLPALHGLLAVWHANFFELPTAAVIPYDQRLGRLPAYLQQLAMESNGKRVSASGAPVAAATEPVLWGEPGTTAQHSFFQLLHQGTEVVPCDFIVFARPGHGLRRHHDLLVANALAQPAALAFGRSPGELREQGVPEQLVPHRTMPGNRPSNVILGERLDPAALGSLIALYEHSVFTRAVIWGINPFDQWGVELGKQLAGEVAAGLREGGDGAASAGDSSTRELIRRYRSATGG